MNLGRGGKQPIDEDITVKLDDIAHLFVAPEIDPFSDQEGELLGQPALIHMLRQLGQIKYEKANQSG